MSLNAQINKSLDEIIKDNRKMRPKKPAKKAKATPEAAKQPRRRVKNKSGNSSAMEVDSIAGRLGSNGIKPAKASKVLSTGRLAGRVGKAESGRLAGLAGKQQKNKRLDERLGKKPKDLNITIKGEAGPATIFISNLDTEASTEDVRTCFKQFGAIKACTLLYDHSGKASGHAEVTYSTKVAAEEAVSKLNNVLADGRRLAVRLVPPGQSQSSNVAPFAAQSQIQSRSHRKGRKYKRNGGNRMDID
ncbi:hypothetical protein LPJ78_004418 [Coemansia sp. RSA 989]|nr:hypothetical protein BX667DRAFT_498047 [Coemansia mojavensis]KAJ1748799.1 hypothetical protein LPJ79_004248 [Coemansia sp. RSA 1821]KAJ1862888.1 hypothetical protein LPJ78_004418 [Coemansia sp. RSA 989]KAJ1870695.1 hypothetical protein LPJ55_004456 [Coemansia sp. RSA 990]KAJ2630512.1 hypothetical protein H4R22_002620 [Coemansia sp. RSA 1290]KAJ2653575.1 hypothetical protein IWW40_000269 [Coemansia sp. RSA 1250]